MHTLIHPHTHTGSMFKNQRHRDKYKWGNTKNSIKPNNYKTAAGAAKELVCFKYCYRFRLPEIQLFFIRFFLHSHHYCSCLSCWWWWWRRCWVFLNLNDKLIMLKVLQFLLNPAHLLQRSLFVCIYANACMCLFVCACSSLASKRVRMSKSICSYLNDEGRVREFGWLFGSFFLLFA